MESKEVVFFTERDEEFIALLNEMGFKKTVATALVYLSANPEVTARDIEKGADLSQPEVSLAMAYLLEKHWISSRELKREKKGRPQKIFRLTKTLPDIFTVIEREKTEETHARLAKMKKLQGYARTCSNGAASQKSVS